MIWAINYTILLQSQCLDFRLHGGSVKFSPPADNSAVWPCLGNLQFQHYPRGSEHVAGSEAPAPRGGEHAAGSEAPALRTNIEQLHIRQKLVLNLQEFVCLAHIKKRTIGQRARCCSLSKVWWVSTF